MPGHPHSLCPFWLFSHPPTSPIWLRLWSVWERRQESVWLSHDPGLAYGAKPMKDPLSVAWIHETAAWREVKSLLIFLGCPCALGRQGVGAPVGHRWLSLPPPDKGANCFYFTPMSSSPRNVLWPNRISGLPEDLVYPKPRATPTSLPPLTVPQGPSRRSGQEA